MKPSSVWKATTSLKTETLGKSQLIFMSMTAVSVLQLVLKPACYKYCELEDVDLVVIQFTFLLRKDIIEVGV